MAKQGFIGFRASEHEKVVLSILAKKNGTSASDTVRTALYLMAERLEVQTTHQPKAVTAFLDSMK